MSGLDHKIQESALNQENWFENLIAEINAQLKSDQLMLETQTASKEKEAFYSAVKTQNIEQLFEINKNTAHQYFISKILYEYIEELKKRDCKPLKLAVDHTNSKVLVWAEIEDEDEFAERNLILAEAKVNAKYYSKGFHVSSVIMEKSDNYPVPSHYKTIIAANA